MPTFNAGYRLDGEYYYDEKIVINQTVDGSSFHSLRLVVDNDYGRSTKVFLDDSMVGSFQEHFVPRLKGGVFVTHKNGSVGLFRNFKITEPRCDFGLDSEGNCRGNHFQLVSLSSYLIAQKQLQAVIVSLTSISSTSEFLPNPIYVQPSNKIVTLKNDQIPIPASTTILGNVPRTIAEWWRTTQNDSYNIYDCGRPGKCGASFAFGRWFGEHGTSSKGLTYHTWCDVGRYGKDVGPSDNTWHHFSHVWDGSTHYLYYDGELYYQGLDKNGKLKTSADGCVFGSKDSRFDFIGDIKGLCIYRAALTLKQIKKIKG